MGRLFDYIAFLRAVPSGRAVFLRREYDRFARQLSWIARLYRRTVIRRTRIVAVVGSLGKTTTARAVSEALGLDTSGDSRSNYGSTIAVDTLGVRPGSRHAVFEAGVSGPGQMSRYGSMLRPDVVVVTSIKSDHNRSFKTLLNTRQEKVEMVRALTSAGIALLNGDDPNVRWMATQTHGCVVTFGLGEENDIRAIEVGPGKDGGIGFKVKLEDTLHTVRSSLIGEHMVYPLLAALSVAWLERVELAGAIDRLSRVENSPGRLQMFHLRDGTLLIDDSFKGGLESVHAAFDAVAGLTGARKVVVLGNVEEPVGVQGEIYRDLGRRLAGFADQVVCIGGDNMRAVRTGAAGAGMPRERIRLAGRDLAEATETIREVVRPGDVVLVKGASSQRLRRIVMRLRGREVGCSVRSCSVRIPECDVCPLVNGPAEAFRVRIVHRYFPEGAA